MGLNKRVNIFFFVLVSINFVSCSYIKNKIGEYYLNKAKKISQMDEVSENDIDRFYKYVMKALDYKPNIPQSIKMVEYVTQASLKAGYVKAYEDELKFYKKYVDKNPMAFDVYLNIINIFSLKGDLYNLENIKEDFERQVDKNKSFKVLSFITETNLLYWTGVYGENSLNVSYDEVYNYLNRYCNYAKNIYNVKLLNDNGFFKDVSSELMYYFNTTFSDFLSNEKKVKQNCDIFLSIKNNSNLQKIIRYVIDGNRHFSKKEYSNAMIYYKAALSLDESFYEARKNIIEAGFQNHLSLSLMKRSKEDLISFIYDNISYLDEIIAEKDEIVIKMPFTDKEKFISQVYSLNAAMMSVFIDENISPDKKQKIEQRIKRLLEQSIKYDPSNKMAKELLNRFENK